jgi:hypothetical protein
VHHTSDWNIDIRCLITLCNINLMMLERLKQKR